MCIRDSPKRTGVPKVFLQSYALYSGLRVVDDLRRFLLILPFMLPPRYLTYFAYSSSGTPNFLAIATCEGVSFTDLRPVLAPLLTGATA